MMATVVPLTLSPVPDLHLENSSKDSEQTLLRLLRAHHVDHSIFWNMGDFGIHIPDEHKDSGIHIVHTPHASLTNYFQH